MACVCLGERTTSLFRAVRYVITNCLGVRIMKMPVLSTILLTSLLALTGCNTLEGAGQDIEAGGEKMQTKAKEVKNNM